MKRLLLLGAFTLSIFLSGQNALHFDGQNDKIDVGNPSNLQIAGNSMTVEAWINASSWTAQVWQGNVVNQENNSTNDGFMLRVGANGTLNFGIGTATTAWYEVNSNAGLLQLNTWTHIAGTYDGSYIRIYKDGQPIDSLSVTGGIVAGNVPLTIGARNNDRFYNGLIDEVRIWSVTRTKAEISQDMNNEFCGNIQGLELYYKLNEGIAGGSNQSVTTAPDFSANNNSGTLSGFTLSGNTSNWVGGKTLNLPPGDSVAVSDSLCDGYKYYIGNQVISTTGNHKVHLVNQNGCDSLVDLTLYPQVVDASAKYVGQSFVANNSSSNATYQWVNCATWGILVGETNQTYWPSDNGEYAVYVTENGCMDTSDCMSLLYASTDEYIYRGFKLYPNPTSKTVKIELGELLIPDQDLILLDLQGRVVRSSHISSIETKIDVSELSQGTYVVQLISSDTIRIQLLIIQ
ncbi:MAG: T9SS type A sorting domain-containing protein [Schleiferiaceae bacterium]|nr:T9SS type A sorting domain-containing protein [Schleiferiaceae bacterium]